jgi:hypothetical protein
LLSEVLEALEVIHLLQEEREEADQLQIQQTTSSAMLQEEEVVHRIRTLRSTAQEESALPGLEERDRALEAQRIVGRDLPLLIH